MRDHSKGHIRIISPASSEGQLLSGARLDDLRRQFPQLHYQALTIDTTWPFAAASVADRVQQLVTAVRDRDVSALLAARGGYGVSDLLPHIPWTDLKRLKPVPVVGFSDISALHSAFFTQLGWHGIHGPMPGTDYWGQNGSQDVELLGQLLKGETPPIDLPLLYLGRGMPPQINGWAFGGCLSVLTNLIGTPYFPRSLEGALLYWEDIGEHPARIIRFANQWLQSGALKGVKGLILGRFMGCELAGQFTESGLHQVLASRLGIPVWFSPLFGHCSPNWPLPFGRELRVQGESLSWNWDTSYG